MSGSARYTRDEWPRAEQEFKNHMVFNFHPREIACKHCGEIWVDWHALVCLQALRNQLDRPVALTSAYRCSTHNKAVGGARHSMHLVGKAFDVIIPHDIIERMKFLAIAGQKGFRGFGWYRNFIHIDTRAEYTAWHDTAVSEIDDL